MIVNSSNPVHETMPNRKSSALNAFLAALLGLGSCTVTSGWVFDSEHGWDYFWLPIVVCVAVTVLTFNLMASLDDAPEDVAGPGGAEPQAVPSEDRSATTSSTSSGAPPVLAFFGVVSAAFGALAGADGGFLSALACAVGFGVIGLVIGLPATAVLSIARRLTGNKR